MQGGKPYGNLYVFNGSFHVLKIMVREREREKERERERKGERGRKKERKREGVGGSYREKEREGKREDNCTKLEIFLSSVLSATEVTYLQQPMRTSFTYTPPFPWKTPPISRVTMERYACITYTQCVHVFATDFRYEISHQLSVA